MLKWILLTKSSAVLRSVITANGEVQTHEEFAIHVRIGYVLDCENPRGNIDDFLVKLIWFNHFRHHYRKK